MAETEALMEETESLMEETESLMNETAVYEVDEILELRIEEMISRMQVLEDTIVDQNDKIDKNIADMCQLIRSFSVNKGVASSSEDPNLASPEISLLNSDSVKGRSGMLNSYSGVTWSANLDFPRFNGEKIWEWLYKVEQFFAIDHTPEELKVGIASFHFDNVAAIWHQTVVQSDLGKSINQDWSTYKKLLQERFEDVLDDPVAELKQLQETDGIMEYHKQFESIICRVNLPEKYLVSMYLAGLRMDTQMNIRIFQPYSITECLRLGRLYEKANPRPVISSGCSSAKATNNTQAKKNSELNGETQMQSDVPKTVSNKRWKVLSAEEIYERDTKGLCYVCDEKYTPEHDVKHNDTQFFVVESEKEREELLRNF